MMPSTLDTPSPGPGKKHQKNFRPDTLELLSSHCSHLKASSPVQLEAIHLEGDFGDAMTNRISPLVDTSLNQHSESGIYAPAGKQNTKKSAKKLKKNRQKTKKNY